MSRSRFQLLVLVGHYPSAYKPYYDTQFIDLIRAGVDVRIGAAPPLDAHATDHLESAGVLDRVAFYPMSGRDASLASLSSLLIAPRRLARWGRRLRPGSLRTSVVDLFRVAALPPAPDAVLVHGVIVAVRFAWLRRLLPHTPIALYYHGGEVPSVPDQSDNAVAAAFHDCDLVFTNTRFSRQQAIDRGCPPDSTRVLPVGFNLEEFQPPAQRQYRRGGTLHLVSVGRLSEEKGIHFAVEAVRSVVESGRSAIHFSIIGDGYYRGRIESMIAEYGLEQHVSLLGALPAAAVREQMGAADALVLPSVPLGNWAETQACAVQEAMLMKALALTSQMGGVPESIPDEMKPLSFPPGQPEAIAAAIMRVYDMSPAEMARLGDAACDFVRANYDIVQLNRKMLSELRDIRGPASGQVAEHK